MEIVNIHHRVAYDVYGGRPTKGRDPRDVPVGEYGWLGNPFPVVNGERGTALKPYAEYFYARIADDTDFRQAVLNLRGRRVACFCAPKPCHLNIVQQWLIGVE